MPTGYTALIEDGVSFEKFTLRCARAFGALITMRDDPMDANIPEELVVDSYYQERYLEACEELEQLKAMTEKEKTIAAMKDYEASVKTNNAIVAKKKKLLKKYQDMLEKVNAWEPPTPDHEGLKKFMKEQIESSIKWDCDFKYCKDPIALSDEEWYKIQLESAEHDIEYFQKQYEAECERVAGNTKWIQALRKSLTGKVEV